MKLFTLTFLYLCFQGLPRSTTAEIGAEDPNKARNGEWWKLSPPRKPEQGIGEGVSLLAYVFYDSEFKAKEVKPERSTPTVDASDHTETYFKGLFDQVQVYFRNQSINITVNIKSVSEKSDWITSPTVIYYARDVLQELMTHGKSLHQPANTAFYLFSWGNTKFIGSEHTNPGGLGQSAIETYHTFCSSNTSAAVIRHEPGSSVSWSTIKATSYMFGSKHFLKYSDEDWETMNKTFEKCLKLDANIPVC